VSAVKHTPGPWRVFLTKDGRRVIGIGELTGEGIADCGFGVWRGGSAEAIANAYLIAAAPELLAALKAAQAIRPGNWDDDDDPDQAAAWRAVDAAIAKAEGGAP
jgi:hypothetical protein